MVRIQADNEQILHTLKPAVEKDRPPTQNTIHAMYCMYIHVV